MSALPHHYAVYGAQLTTEWPMALPPVPAGFSPIAEVDLVEGELPAVFPGCTGPTAPPVSSRFFADGSAYVAWRDFYEFHVSASGRRLSCRPVEGTERLVLQNFLLPQVLSFAFVFQALEPLHAAAVEIDGEAVAFLGDCTYGKSTLLASFLAAGHRLVTDDLLMIRAEGDHFVALPGSGRIKLRPDAAEAFIAADTPNEPLNARADKRSFVPAEVVRDPLRLRHFFVLSPPEERRDQRRTIVDALSRVEACHAIVQGAFNVDIFTRDRLARLFDNATALASRLPVSSLRYPDGLEHLPSIRQRVIEWTQCHGSLS